jgi:hypothetical protein
MSEKRTNARTNATAKVTADSIFSEVNKLRAGMNLPPIDESKKIRSTGENGIDVGFTCTFTGVINLAIPVTNANGDTTATYMGAETTDGRYVSLARLMGLSAMGNYVVSGEYPHVSAGVESKIKASAVENFDFTDAYQPPTRNVYEFAAYLKESNFLANKKGTLLAKAVNPYKAKKAMTLEFDSWKAGDPRCMTATLWKIG